MGETRKITAAGFPRDFGRLSSQVQRKNFVGRFITEANFGASIDDSNHTININTGSKFIITDRFGDVLQDLGSVLPVNIAVMHNICVQLSFIGEDCFFVLIRKSCDQDSIRQRFKFFETHLHQFVEDDSLPFCSLNAWAQNRFSIAFSDNCLSRFCIGQNPIGML